MKQWGFYFDQTRCVNCKACILSCKAWNETGRGDVDLNPEQNYLTHCENTTDIEYDIMTDTSREQNQLEHDNQPDRSEIQSDVKFIKYHMKENWRRVYVTEYGSSPPNVDVLNLSISCNHCDDPLCIKSCPTHYIYKELTFGTVQIDNKKPCISCGKCKKSCPWSSPQFYKKNHIKYGRDDQTKPKMTKCNLCIERISEGLKPACVAACMMRALDAGPMDELKQKYSKWTDQVENFPKSGNIKPNIIFKKKTRKV